MKFNFFEHLVFLLDITPIGAVLGGTPKGVKIPHEFIVKVDKEPSAATPRLLRREQHSKSLLSYCGFGN